MAEDDTNNAQAHQHFEPPPGLKSLDRLVGTWEISGGAQGRTTFEWMEGGVLLEVHRDAARDGRSDAPHPQVGGA
jgi:hypothetical protein